jgi:hypothetical protein
MCYVQILGESWLDVFCVYDLARGLRLRGTFKDLRVHLMIETLFHRSEKFVLVHSRRDPSDCT